MLTYRNLLIMISFCTESFLIRNNQDDTASMIFSIVL